MEKVEVTLNDSIQAVKVTKENYKEVVKWLTENKIPCDLSSDGFKIYSNRNGYERSYKSVEYDSGDYIVLLPFVSERIINCWIVPESDFERRFT